mmetsp:Transcript_98498/g.317581  ORF Transcript_98498/g.317581 Transcript_98498/m.317581 type:complete len:236 (+) Transcript_98498:703-1410(+)
MSSMCAPARCRHKATCRRCCAEDLAQGARRPSGDVARSNAASAVGLRAAGSSVGGWSGTGAATPEPPRLWWKRPEAQAAQAMCAKRRKGLEAPLSAACHAAPSSAAVARCHIASCGSAPETPRKPRPAARGGKRESGNCEATWAVALASSSARGRASSSRASRSKAARCSCRTMEGSDPSGIVPRIDAGSMPRTSWVTSLASEDSAFARSSSRAAGEAQPSLRPLPFDRRARTCR